MMGKMLAGAFMVGLLTLVSGQSSADAKSVDFLSFKVNGSPVITVHANELDSDVSIIGSEEGGYAEFQSRIYDVKVQATFHNDPSISYGIVFTNFTAVSQTFTVTFTNVFSPPESPVFAPYSSESSVSGSFTDGSSTRGGNGGAVTGISQVTEVASSIGGPWIPLGVNLTTANCVDLAGIPKSRSCDSASIVNPYGALAGPGPFRAMRTTLKLTLTGGRDVATYNGEAAFFPVPEPATIGLLGLGLVGLGLRQWRRPSV